MSRKNIYLCDVINLKKLENMNNKELQMPFKRYTMDEINAMLDDAEERFAQGIYYTNDEVFRQWNERKKRRRMLKNV